MTKPNASVFALFLRRLRSEKLASLGLVGLVLTIALCAAAGPRVLEDAASRALHGDVSAAPSAERTIRLVQTGRIEGSVSAGPTEGAPNIRLGAGTSAGLAAAAVDARGRALEQTFDPAVERLVASRSYVAETPLWNVASGPGTSAGAVVTFRAQKGVEAHIQFVAGRFPSGAPNPATGVDSGFPEPTFQVAMSAEAAQKLGLAVGDELMVVGGRTSAAIARIAGIYRAVDAADPFWIDDDSVLHSVLYAPKPLEEHVQAALLLAPGSLDSLLSATADVHGGVSFSYSWRYYIDPARLDNAALGDLVAGMRRLESQYPPRAAAAPDAASAQGGLLRILLDHQGRWNAAQAVLGIVATGIAVVAVAMIWLAVQLVSTGRRRTVAVCRRRGASTIQIGRAALLEALLLCVPPAVVAAWLAALAIPRAPAEVPALAAVLVAAMATVLILRAVLGGDGRYGGAASRATDERREGGGRVPGASSGRRVVLEGALIVASLAGAHVLRERGVASLNASVAPAPDPLVAAVPALAGVAAGVIAIHAYPAAMRAVARLVAVRRDLVPVLAVRQGARSSGAGAMLLVIIVAATVGSFAAVVAGSLDAGVDAVSWQQVGAPYRVESLIGPLNQAVDPTKWPGVEAVAKASQEPAASSTGATRLLETIEIEQYAKVVAGTPAAIDVPAEMVGPATGSVPAIVSARAGSAADQLHVGDEFTLLVGPDQVRFRAVEVRESFPGMPNAPFVVVSREQLASFHPNLQSFTLPSPTTLFVRGPDDGVAGLRAALGPRTLDTTIISRAEQAAALRDAPLRSAVVAAVAAAAFVAALFAALAAAAALALASAGRAIGVAHLRTLGLSRRQASSLVVAEFGPAVVVALVAGAILGLGLFAYLQPGLGLANLVGSASALPASIALPQLAFLVAVTAVGTAAGIVLAAANQSSVSPATAVRMGTE